MNDFEYAVDETTLLIFNDTKHTITVKTPVTQTTNHLRHATLSKKVLPRIDLTYITVHFFGGTTLSIELHDDEARKVEEIMVDTIQRANRDYGEPAPIWRIGVEFDNF
ncbi:hypothetical protein ACP6H1_21790 [Vibrio harveyi]|uniref:hypothetical protein n=1 Tax=Vibrio harveyi TaxID=669 RepID=UPI003CE97EB1